MWGVIVVVEANGWIDGSAPLLGMAESYFILLGNFYAY